MGTSDPGSARRLGLEQPASSGMRGLLEAEMKGSAKGIPGAIVQGKDDRTQITHIDANVYPQATVGWLWTQDQKGSTGRPAPATLIGPARPCITAAHCVYDHATGGWVEGDDVLSPARPTRRPRRSVCSNGTMPTSSRASSTITTARTMARSCRGTSPRSSSPTMPARRPAGWASRSTTARTSTPTMVELSGRQARRHHVDADNCDIPAKDFGDQVFKHTCDTASGSSGAPMYEDSTGKGEFYIRGINVAEDDNSELRRPPHRQLLPVPARQLQIGSGLERRRARPRSDPRGLSLSRNLGVRVSRCTTPSPSPRRVVGA